LPSTPKQLTDQATRHAVYLERYKSGAVNAYDDMLKLMEKRILAELSGDITEWNRVRLNKQLTAIKGVINDVSSDMDNLFGKQILELADYEAGYEVRSLDNLGMKVDFDLPSDRQLKAAVYSTPMQVTGPYQGSLLAPYIDDWSKSSIRRVSNAVRLGFANGVTTQQLVRDLEAVGGAFNIDRRDWSNIVRTGMAHTANTAREATWKANSDIIKGVRINATLDSKTSTTCRSLDGQVFPIDKGPRPPFHINCRTTTTAALDDRFAVLEEGGTRFARDPETGKVGSAPANQTYYGWLKGQPAKVQNDIIGPTRGKLLRNGGLSSERFAELQVGKRFEPITLEKMREMEPIAFEKAGI